MVFLRELQRAMEWIDDRNEDVEMNNINMQEISIEKNELLSSDVCSVIDILIIRKSTKFNKLLMRY